MLFALLACTTDPIDTSAGPGRDSGADTADSGGGDPDTSDPGVPYAAGDGPYKVTARASKLAGADVDVYTPAGDGPFPVVLWAHGFFRKKEQHVDAATHAASWGFLVVAPDLPEFSDHQANGEWLANDLLPEVQALPVAGPEVLMVGHSAGGLASLVGAGLAHADAWVGLDPVDASSIGAGADQDVTGAALLLHGEPGTCNSDGSAYGWKTGGEQWTVTVTDGNHCDFESNTDSTCTAFCGDPDDARAALIQQYAVAWLVQQTGGDAAAWMQGGSVAEADKKAKKVSW